MVHLHREIYCLIEIPLLHLSSQTEGLGPWGHLTNIEGMKESILFALSRFKWNFSALQCLKTTTPLLEILLGRVKPEMFKPRNMG